MNTDDGAVNGSEFQVNLTEILFHLNEFLENPLDDSVPGQGKKALVNGVPISEFLWQIAPRGTGFENPKHSIDISSFVIGMPPNGGVNHELL